MLPAAATFPHRRLRSSQAEQALEGVVEAIPGVIGKIKDLVGKKNSDSADESDDAE